MYQLAHRGYSDCFPENTIIAFRYALEKDYDGIETDIQQTKDGKLVLLHDYKINRTSNGKGYLKDYNYSDLRQYDFHGKFKIKATIPTLEELLMLVKESGKIANLEIKENVLDLTVEKTVEMVKAFDVLEQIYFSSTSLEQMLLIRELLPDSYCALISDYDYLWRKQMTVKYHLNGIHARYTDLTRDEIRYFKEHNIMVGAWTIKNQKDFDYFKEQDIMFIFTNRYFK